MHESVRAETLASFIGLIAIASLYVADPVAPIAAAGVLAVLVVIASWQPVVVLGLIAATLALFHQPFHAGNRALAPSELLLAAAAIGTLVRVTGGNPSDHRDRVRMWNDLKSGLKRLRIPFGRVTIGALILIAVVEVGLLVQIDDPIARSAGARELRWTIIEPLLFVGLLLWNVSTKRERSFVAGAFVAGGLCVAIWGLADAFGGVGVRAGGVTRASGPFPHPNAFALYLLRPVVLGTAYVVVARVKAISPWIACGLGGAALVTSFSRSAALGLVVAFIVLWPWISKQMRLLTVTGSGILAAALAVIARDRAFGGSGQDSLALRVDIWRSGIAMISDRPVLGYGPDQFLYVYTPRYVDPAGWAERFTSHGHNLIIDAWVRVGIIGAVCVVLALVFVARSARGPRHDKAQVCSRPVAVCGNRRSDCRCSSGTG